MEKKGGLDSADNITQYIDEVKTPQILSLLVQEKTDKEIAKALHISERTVRNHLASIQKKLGTYSRVGTAVQAVKRGLVSENPSQS